MDEIGEMESKKMIDIEKAWTELMTDVDKHKTDRMQTRLYTFYEKYTDIDFIDFKNSNLVDFGCGGGFFGKYAFENLEIHTYCGIDILQESIDYANELLKGNNFYTKKIAPYDILKNWIFEEENIFTSFSVIQHFISKEYLDTFLDQINNFKFEWIILHFRDADKTFFYQDRTYTTTKSITYACHTNVKYISKFLTNYKRIKKDENIGYWKYDK